MSERERLANWLHEYYADAQGADPDSLSAPAFLKDADEVLALLRSTESDERKDAVVGEGSAAIEALRQVFRPGRIFDYDPKARTYMIGMDDVEMLVSAAQQSPARPTEETRSSGAEEADEAWSKVETCMYGIVGSTQFERTNLVSAISAAVRAEIRTTKGGAV